MNKINQDPLSAPVYLKTDKDMEWPKDKFFYLLAKEGLFKCRSTAWTESCVPVEKGPSDLASQSKFLRLSYPQLPKALVERVVGFFRLIADKQNSEAAAIWVWNKLTEEVELLIPDQIGINGSPTNKEPHGWPMDVKYETPKNLPPHLQIIGDIHCHVDGSAYASGTDTDDEVHRPGIHIVVGHIFTKPTFFCEAVCDGSRFSVDDLSLVWEGFDKMDTASVPPEWIAKVKLEEKKWNIGGLGMGGGYMGVSNTKFKTSDSDVRICDDIIADYKKKGEKPTSFILSQTMFRKTKTALYSYTDKRAEEALAEWDKKEEKQHEAALTP